ncbi:hypothetical protein ERJ75_000636800 [Trypanosoma vivax]|nr:hypothetical protein ERJ75_000636800 [Trypanosoma vivax]
MRGEAPQRLLHVRQSTFRTGMRRIGSDAEAGKGGARDGGEGLRLGAAAVTNATEESEGTETGKICARLDGTAGSGIETQRVMTGRTGRNAEVRNWQAQGAVEERNWATEVPLFAGKVGQRALTGRARGMGQTAATWGARRKTRRRGETRGRRV